MSQPSEPRPGMTECEHKIAAQLLPITARIAEHALREKINGNIDDAGFKRLIDLCFRVMRLVERYSSASDSSTHGGEIAPESTEKSPKKKGNL